MPEAAEVTICGLYVDKVTISPLKAKKKGKPRTWKVKTKVDGKWETAGELPLDLQSRQLGDKVTKITAMLRATNRPKDRFLPHTKHLRSLVDHLRPLWKKCMQVGQTN